MDAATDKPHALRVSVVPFAAGALLAGLGAAATALAAAYGGRSLLPAVVAYWTLVLPCVYVVVHLVPRGIVVTRDGIVMRYWTRTRAVRWNDIAEYVVRRSRRTANPQGLRILLRDGTALVIPQGTISGSCDPLLEALKTHVERVP